MAPRSAESPTLATGTPWAKTDPEPLLTCARCPTQTHFVPKHLSMVCGCSLSPGLTTAMPFANTENCDASTPAVLEQECPVEALSLFLDICGMYASIYSCRKPVVLVGTVFLEVFWNK